MSGFRRNLRAAAPVAGATLAVLLAAAGCARRQQQGQFKMPPMPVETAVATRETLADRFAAVGTLEAVEQITVVSEVDGRIVSLPFREGTEVRRGSVVAQLDDAELKADAARAEAVAAQRRAAHDRVKSVVDQQAGAPQDLDDAAAALKVAEADLALAKTRLAKARITAPFDGTIGARRVSVGHFLRGGETITELARLKDLRVRFTAPERYLDRLRRGAPVTVEASAFPGRPLAGEIEVVEPVVDEATRAARVVARVPNPEGLLRPGMSADVTVVLAEIPDALTVPSEAVFAQGEAVLVYRVQPDSTVAIAPLALGLRLADRVQVVSGLAAGDLVVSAGHQKLFPGAKVLPLPAGGAGATGAPGGDAAAPAGGDAR